jgi:tetratricopeptide (TPR) repeat protein
VAPTPERPTLAHPPGPFGGLASALEIRYRRNAAAVPAAAAGRSARSLADHIGNMKGTVLLLAAATASTAVQARAAHLPVPPYAVAAALSSVGLQQQLTHVDARRSKKREVPFPARFHSHYSCHMYADHLWRETDRQTPDDPLCCFEQMPKAPPPSGPQSVAAKALLKQGKDAQRLGDGARAMSYFEQAVEAATADGDAGSAARAHGAAGRLLLSVGDGSQAVERLGQAVAADPTYSAGHLNLAHAHLTNGDHRRGQIASSTRDCVDGRGGHTEDC